MADTLKEAVYVFVNSYSYTQKQNRFSIIKQNHPTFLFQIVVLCTTISCVLPRTAISNTDAADTAAAGAFAYSYSFLLTIFISSHDNFSYAENYPTFFFLLIFFSFDLVHIYKYLHLFLFFSYFTIETL